MARKEPVTWRPHIGYVLTLVLAIGGAWIADRRELSGLKAAGDVIPAMRNREIDAVRSEMQDIRNRLGRLEGTCR